MYMNGFYSLNFRKTKLRKNILDIRKTGLNKVKVHAHSSF